MVRNVSSVSRCSLIELNLISSFVSFPVYFVYPSLITSRISCSINETDSRSLFLNKFLYCRSTDHVCDSSSSTIVTWFNFWKNTSKEKKYRNLEPVIPRDCVRPGGIVVMLIRIPWHPPPSRHWPKRKLKRKNKEQLAVKINRLNHYIQ